MSKCDVSGCEQIAVIQIDESHLPNFKICETHFRQKFSTLKHHRLDTIYILRIGTVSELTFERAYRTPSIPKIILRFLCMKWKDSILSGYSLDDIWGERWAMIDEVRIYD